LTSEDLDGIIEEIDEDGSGTIDFDGKCETFISQNNIHLIIDSLFFRIYGDDDWISGYHRVVIRILTLSSFL